MGYETTILIGNSHGVKLDAKDYSESPPVDLGFKSTYFMIYAQVDLCKMGYDGEFHKHLPKWKNKDASHKWEFVFDGNSLYEDLYGESFTPQPIETVLSVLKKEAKTDSYRRIGWAIALLEAMKDDPEELTVLCYGH